MSIAREIGDDIDTAFRAFARAIASTIKVAKECDNIDEFFENLKDEVKDSNDLDPTTRLMISAAGSEEEFINALKTMVSIKDVSEFERLTK